MKPLIGVTCSEIVDTIPSWRLNSYGVHSDYVDAVLAAGGLPVILPLIPGLSQCAEIIDKLDGLLISGGENLRPESYRQASHPAADWPGSELRDSNELEYYRHALAQNKPILGICRGMQLINVAQGGTLYQHIDEELPGSLDHRASAHAGDPALIVHRLRVEPDSKLATALGVVETSVNSRHQQAVRELGNGLKISARANDGVIEAIELDSRPFVIGVQCHPESLIESPANDSAPAWLRLFEAFISAAVDVAGPKSA